MNGRKYLTMKVAQNRIRELEEAVEVARRVVSRMPNKPTVDENGEYNMVWLSISAPIWDAIDELRATLAALEAE
jgi:hypothetical protein